MFIIIRTHMNKVTLFWMGVTGLTVLTGSRIMQIRNRNTLLLVIWDAYLDLEGHETWCTLNFKTSNKLDLIILPFIYQTFIDSYLLYLLVKFSQKMLLVWGSSVLGWWFIQNVMIYFQNIRTKLSIMSKLLYVFVYKPCKIIKSWVSLSSFVM